MRKRHLTNAKAWLPQLKCLPTSPVLFLLRDLAPRIPPQVVSLQFMINETKDKVERTRSFPRLSARSVDKKNIRGSNVLLKIHPD